MPKCPNHAGVDLNYQTTPKRGWRCPRGKEFYSRDVWIVNPDDPNAQLVSIRTGPRGTEAYIGTATAEEAIEGGGFNKKEPWNPQISIWQNFKTKVMGRAIELIIIFSLAAIVVYYFPFWEKIGYALVFYGFYITFPDKYDLYFRATKMLDAREKRMGRSLPENAAAELVQDQVKSQMGWIWTKLFLKLMITFLVGVQFISVHPLIALIVFLYTYFSLASGYSEDEPDKAVEGWYRFFLGIFIATFFWAVFSGQASLFENSFQIFFTMFTLGIYPLVVYILPDYALWLAGQPPAPATILFFLALAYFATFPAQMERR